MRASGHPRSTLPGHPSSAQDLSWSSWDTPSPAACRATDEGSYLLRAQVQYRSATPVVNEKSEGSDWQGLVAVGKEVSV